MGNETQKYFELYLFLWNEAEKLIHEFEDLRFLRYDEFSSAFEMFMEKLRGLADRCIHEFEDLKPPQEEAFPITDELCEEAFRAGFAAKNFSIGFLQRRFLIGYSAARELRERLLFDRKITRAFLVGNTICKG